MQHGYHRRAFRPYLGIHGPRWGTERPPVARCASHPPKRAERPVRSQRPAPMLRELPEVLEDDRQGYPGECRQGHDGNEGEQEDAQALGAQEFHARQA